MVKNFIQEFDKYKNMIISKNNFAYTRYADGEVKLMNGKSVGPDTQAFQSDGWSCDSKMYRLGEDLFKSLSHREPNYYYAITSPNQSQHDYSFLKNNIKQPDTNITFADLWINGNYNRFKYFLNNELNEHVYIIASQNGLNKNLGPIKTIGYYPIPKDCVNYYEVNNASIKQDMKRLAQHNNTLFFISAGPMSEVLIHELYSENPNNRYIDVGSAIDEYVHGKVTRPYMLNGTIYNKEIVEWSTI